MTVDRDVSAEQMNPLCSALAQLRGELIVGDWEECGGFAGGSTVQLPQAASIHRLDIGPGNYDLRIPKTLVTWPQLEVVDWCHDSSHGRALHVELPLAEDALP